MHATGETPQVEEMARWGERKQKAGLEDQLETELVICWKGIRNEVQIRQLVELS